MRPSTSLSFRTDDVLSYTLVDVGNDEISRLGLFSSEAGATRASELAMAWAKDRLAALGAALLEASDGALMLHCNLWGLISRRQ